MAADRTGARTGPFQRSDRLLDGRDYERVLRRGRRRQSAELAVVTTARRDPERRRRNEPDTGVEGSARASASSRLGITASRKTGNAVVRNRFKRRVREWFRRNREALPEPLDIVVIARPAAAELESAAVADRLAGLLLGNRSEVPGMRGESRSR